MKRTIRIGLNVLEPALRHALSKEAWQRDFFAAFRYGITWRIEELIKQAGAAPSFHKPPAKYFRPTKPLVSLEPIVLRGQSVNAEFCLGYGYGDGTVSALNYLYEGSRQNSVLPFLESDSFTIGNFILRLEPGEYEFDIEFADGVKAAGYVAEIRPESVRSFLVILGLRFASEVIKSIVGTLPDLERLDELSPCSSPPQWINRRTGQVFTCECFAYVAKRMRRRGVPKSSVSDSGEEGMPVRPGLCSICSDHVPPPDAGHPMYFNAFLQRYRPYRDLFMRKMFDGIKLNVEHLKEAERIAEDAARLAVGYPLIGQRWITETALCRTVRSLLSPRIVVQHYQGKELEGLEIDIWVPSLRLAIEYHGPQHFEALQAWGGETALAATKERDKRKRALLKRLRCKQLVFRHDEQFTEETVLERIRPFLSDGSPAEIARKQT